MRLYSAGEIVKKLHGVNTRQILDLAEKGLIVPARETTGAGSARLYDFQNIFEICVCLAVRGRIPAGPATTQELTGNILKHIRNETQRDQNNHLGPTDKIIAMAEAPFLEKVHMPPFDILLIAYDNKENYEFHPIFYKDTFQYLQRIKKYKPQNYCTYTIEVVALWNFLRRIF